MKEEKLRLSPSNSMFSKKSILVSSAKNCDIDRQTLTEDDSYFPNLNSPTILVVCLVIHMYRVCQKLLHFSCQVPSFKRSMFPCKDAKMGKTKEIEQNVL